MTEDPKRKMLHLRMEKPGILDTLDDWRTSQRPILSRNEAVERLLKYALDCIETDTPSPEFWSTVEARAHD